MNDEARDTYGMYRYCREQCGHDRFIQNSEVAMRYFASDQWLSADKLKMAAGGRGHVTVNQIFHTITAVVGEMSQLSTDVRYDAVTGHDDTADALNKLSEHVDRTNKSYVHDQAVMMMGLLTGRGYYDLRMDFSKNMQGNIKLNSKRPQNVILEDIDSPDPNTWNQVFTTEIVSLDDIQMMFGKGVADQVKESPGTPEWIQAEDRTLAQSLGLNRPYWYGQGDVNGTHSSVLKQYRMLSRQYKTMEYKEYFVDLETGDTSEIPDHWDQERIKFALDTFHLGTIRKMGKTMRWSVVVNDNVLFSEDSSLPHFSLVPYFPFFIDGATLSLFDVLKGPQDLLNKALAEEIHASATTSNSGWKIRQGALKNMTMRDLETKGGMNGLVLELENITDAERIEPAQMNQQYQSLSGRATQWVQELGKLTPVMAGTQRADAPGSGIRTQLSRAPINLAIPLTAFHFTKHLLAECKLDLFQTYYTETRVMRIATDSYSPPKTLTINAPQPDGTFMNDLTVGEYAVRLMPVGSRLMSDEFAFDELLELKNVGVVVPNDVLLSVSSINAKAEAIEALRKANGGNVNPAEQQAQALQMQKLQAELDDLKAGTGAKDAQRTLSLARAQRAMAESQYDPRQESNQIQKQRLLFDHAHAMDQMALSREKNTTDAALKLTELHSGEKQTAAQILAAKEQAKLAPKPAATK